MNINDLVRFKVEISDNWSDESQAVEISPLLGCDSKELEEAEAAEITEAKRRMVMILSYVAMAVRVRADETKRNVNIVTWMESATPLDYEHELCLFIEAPDADMKGWKAFVMARMNDILTPANWAQATEQERARRKAEEDKRRAAYEAALAKKKVDDEKKAIDDEIRALNKAKALEIWKGQMTLDIKIPPFGVKTEVVIWEEMLPFVSHVLEDASGDVFDEAVALLIELSGFDYDTAALLLCTWACQVPGDTSVADVEGWVRGRWERTQRAA